MPMYNLIRFSKSYSKITGTLWDYYKDEPNSGAERNINHSIKNSKSFDYKTSITRRPESNNTEKEVEIVVLLKRLSNFWKTLAILLFNGEIDLILTCFENCNNKKNGKRC